MEFKTFDSVEEMFAEIDRSRREADARVEPWQTELKNGDHFIRLYDMNGETLTIYGTVEDSPYDEDREKFNQPHMKNFRMTRCFSQACPDGELGSTHVAAVFAPLTKEEFDFAKETNWPDVRTYISAMEVLGEAIGKPSPFVQRVEQILSKRRG